MRLTQEEKYARDESPIGLDVVLHEKKGEKGEELAHVNSK